MGDGKPSSYGGHEGFIPPRFWGSGVPPEKIFEIRGAETRFLGIWATYPGFSHGMKNPIQIISFISECWKVVDPQKSGGPAPHQPPLFLRACQWLELDKLRISISDMRWLFDNFLGPSLLPNGYYGPVCRQTTPDDHGHGHKHLLPMTSRCAQEHYQTTIWFIGPILLVIRCRLVGY